ncbi:MAG: outer membrane protein assembly factor BamB, contains PQQ-like beta-propeller repeat [Nocardioides sp.]|nr:outer membrane protein assembly factor BamB, contains PQQ-like beta-propeller repeat [Nocardioides sp.]
MRRVRSLLAWLPAVLLVPAAMAASVQLSEQDKTSNPLLELQPTDLGTTWVYDVFDHGKPSGTHTKQVRNAAGVDPDRVDGVAVASSYTAYPGRGRLSNLVYLSADDHAMYQDGLRQDGELLRLEPAAPAYKLPLDKGGTWSYDGTIGTAGLTLQSTIEDIGDVTVAGRVFHDCLHVVTGLDFTLEGGGGDRETTEEWTCPGYGTVRTTDSIPAQDVEVTEELTEFHGAAGSWFAQEPEPVVAEQQPGDTIGFDAGRTRAVPDGALDSTLAWTDLRSADIAYPPVADGDVMALGEEDGQVSGLDLANGQLLWRQQVRAPVVAPLAIGAGQVLVADSRKNLWALGIDDGAARWVHRFDDVVSVSPTVSGGSVVVVTDDGVVSALDLASGRVLWAHDLGVRTRAAPAAAGDLVVVPDVSGGLVALDLADGSQRWSRSLDGALAVGPAALDDRVFVADDGGVVYSLEAADGDVDWETRTRYDPAGDFAVSSDAVTLLVGPERVESFDRDDGDKRWSRRIDETVQSPVVLGGEVVTVTRKAELNARDLEDGRVTRSWALPGADLNPDVPVGLVAGSLVIGTEMNSAAQTTALFAYPVTSHAARNGVSFRSEVRELPAPPVAAPTMTGDTLFVPGADGTLYRSTGADDAEEVATSDGFQPGVVAGADLVVTQVGDEFRAYPVAGGDQLWTFPAESPYPGVLPAIGDDAVFLPEHGVGLAAAGLDGAPRWFTPIDDATAGTRPLPLPGGDVFYGSGTAARYDGDTGDRLWGIDGVQLYAGAAYSDGLVFADLVSTTRASGLAAIDARTGKVRWLHESSNSPIFSGPAAADGVVVWGDSRGLVTAFDATRGSELWTVQLSTTLAGPPVISEGRVYLAETGRNEDVSQRDYRLSAHDLHTGAFLGAYQPTAVLLSGSPSVAGSADGGLMIPTIHNLSSAVVILEPRS